MCEQERKRGFEIIEKYKDKDINLPKRQTFNSAGYDFESAEEIVVPSVWKVFFCNVFNFLMHGDEYQNILPTLVPTGVKAYMQEDEVLCLYNRSSNPFKFGLVLANGVGVGDSDFYNNESDEGHYRFAFYNFMPCDITIKKGQRIGQGVFQKFLKADNDIPVEKQRQGGFGHTEE